MVVPGGLGAGGIAGRAVVIVVWGARGNCLAAWSLGSRAGGSRPSCTGATSLATGMT